MADVLISFSYCVSATVLSVQLSLQHSRAQPQDVYTRVIFECSKESLYHSSYAHHGLVADLHQTGFEPGPSAWEADVITTTPPSRLDNFWVKCFSEMATSDWLGEVNLHAS